MFPEGASPAVLLWWVGVTARTCVTSAPLPADVAIVA